MARLGLTKKNTAGADLQRIPEAPAPRSAPLPKLTARQQAFVDNYLISRNATQAAIKAGYSKKGANVTGSQLLANPNIAAVLGAKAQRVAEKLEISLERTLQEVAKVAFASAANFQRISAEDGQPRIDFRRATEAQLDALAAVTVEEFMDGRSDKRQVRRVKFALHDKAKALDMLMKHLGGYKDDAARQSAEAQLTALGMLLRQIDSEWHGHTIEHESA